MLNKVFKVNNNSKRAFTLTELLVALAIVGAIASLTIPALMNNIQKRMMITQLKNTISSIQQLAGNQLTINKTKTLEDTDFVSPEKLFVEKNFSIAKICGTTDDECWPADVTYRNIKGGAYDNGASNYYSVKLKNGSVLSYIRSNQDALDDDKDDNSIGLFAIDLNGADKPNIAGRDLFRFYITKKGKITHYYVIANREYNETDAIKSCKSGASVSACFAAIMENNWVSPY